MIGVWRCMGRNKNREISAALFKKIEPLLPVFVSLAKGGRLRVSDEMALNGILFVLRTGIPWEELPQEQGIGSGMACGRRLRDWQAAGVWHGLHLMLLSELRSADKLDLSRVSMDTSSAEASRIASRAEASSAMIGSVATAGWSGPLTPGWLPSASCAPDSSVASTLMSRCFSWRAASSAFGLSRRLVSRSYSQSRLISAGIATARMPPPSRFAEKMRTSSHSRIRSSPRVTR
ncbi:hypothetical protein E5CHR_01580 [Variovorax sp. PBL-E5]|nr:hypothetical protein E5CHR_01580 [Variovorax sp. PBL-E5]